MFQVASRKVIFVGGIIMMILGSFGKIGAVFVSIPDPIVGGVSIVLFGKFGSGILSLIMQFLLLHM